MTEQVQQELNTLFELGFKGGLKCIRNDLETNIGKVITYTQLSDDTLQIKFTGKRSDFGLSEGQSGLGDARDYFISALNKVANDSAKRGEGTYDAVATLHIDDTTLAAIKKEQVSYAASRIQGLISGLPDGIQGMVRNQLGGKGK